MTTTTTAPKGHGNEVFCPPNRQLALRAQIKQGWSTMTPKRGSAQKEYQLDMSEIQQILNVIARAEEMERREEIRVGVQMLNYQQLREDAMGDGTTSCILCGLDFTSQRSRKQIPINFCQECGNAVCSRCKTEYVCHSGETLKLCRLCYEKRELWKKSGAWLRNALPVISVPHEELEREWENQKASQLLTRFDSMPTDFRPPSYDHNEGDEEEDYHSFADSISMDFTVHRSLPSSREGSLEPVDFKQSWMMREGELSMSTRTTGPSRDDTQQSREEGSGARRTSPGAAGGHLSRKRQRALRRKSGEQARQRLRRRNLGEHGPSPSDSREGSPSLEQSVDIQQDDPVDLPTQPPAIKLRKPTPPHRSVYDLGPSPQLIDSMSALGSTVEGVEEPHSSSPELTDDGVVLQQRGTLDDDIIPVVEYELNGQGLDTPWDRMLASHRGDSPGERQEEEATRSYHRGRKPVPKPRQRIKHQEEQESGAWDVSVVSAEAVEPMQPSQESVDGFHKVHIHSTPRVPSINEEFSKVIVPSSPKEEEEESPTSRSPLQKQSPVDDSIEQEEFVKVNTGQVSTSSTEPLPARSSTDYEPDHRTESTSTPLQQSPGRPASPERSGSTSSVQSGASPHLGEQGGSRLKRQPARRVTRVRKSAASSLSRVPQDRAGEEEDLEPARHRSRSGAFSGGRRVRPHLDGEPSPIRRAGGRARSNTGDSVASSTSSVASPGSGRSFEEFVVSEHGEKP